MPRARSISLPFIVRNIPKRERQRIIGRPPCRDVPLDEVTDLHLQSGPADTGNLADYPVPLVWDSQVKGAAGTIITAASGTLVVAPDVTRAE